MTLGGWIAFVVSMGLFTGMFVWCICKVLSVDRSESARSKGSGNARAD